MTTSRTPIQNFHHVIEETASNPDQKAVEAKLKEAAKACKNLHLGSDTLNGPDNDTPLMTAVRCGNLFAVTFLLNPPFLSGIKADIDYQNKNYDCALSLAVQFYDPTDQNLQKSVESKADAKLSTQTPANISHKRVILNLLRKPLEEAIKTRMAQYKKIHRWNKEKALHVIFRALQFRNMHYLDSLTSDMRLGLGLNAILKLIAKLTIKQETNEIFNYLKTITDDPHKPYRFSGHNFFNLFSALIASGNPTGYDWRKLLAANVFHIEYLDLLKSILNHTKDGFLTPAEAQTCFSSITTCLAGNFKLERLGADIFKNAFLTATATPDAQKKIYSFFNQTSFYQLISDLRNQNILSRNEASQFIVNLLSIRYGITAVDIAPFISDQFKKRLITAEGLASSITLLIEIDIQNRWIAEQIKDYTYKPTLWPQTFSSAYDVLLDFYERKEADIDETIQSIEQLGKAPINPRQEDFMRVAHPEFKSTPDHRLNLFHTLLKANKSITFDKEFLKTFNKENDLAKKYLEFFIDREKKPELLFLYKAFEANDRNYIHHFFDDEKVFENALSRGDFELVVTCLSFGEKYESSYRESKNDLADPENVEKIKNFINVRHWIHNLQRPSADVGFLKRKILEGLRLMDTDTQEKLLNMCENQFPNLKNEIDSFRTELNPHSTTTTSDAEASPLAHQSQLEYKPAPACAPEPEEEQPQLVDLEMIEGETAKGKPAAVSPDALINEGQIQRADIAKVIVIPAASAPPEFPAEGQVAQPQSELKSASSTPSLGSIVTYPFIAPAAPQAEGQVAQSLASCALERKNVSAEFDMETTEPGTAVLPAQEVKREPSRPAARSRFLQTNQTIELVLPDPGEETRSHLFKALSNISFWKGKETMAAQLCQMLGEEFQKSARR